MRAAESLLTYIAAAVLAPQADDLHVKRQGGGPSVVPIDDRFTPHKAPVIWYAVGDSYTAGPGTGADYDADLDCARNNGSYAVQTESDFPFKEPNDMEFIACSGHRAPETLARVTDFVEQDRADFMVMTVGGNDIGFAAIAVECLVKARFLPGDCDETIRKARQLLAAPKFENDIHAVYDEVFEKMKDDRHYQLYHIFYSRFFNDQTDWCDRMSFGAIVPKLTRELRKKLNLLANDLNRRLEGVVENYIQKQTKASWSQGPRLIGLNPDNLTRSNGETYGLFDGHRFCEPGKTTLRDPSVWFFGTFDKDSVEKRHVGLQTLQQYDASKCEKDPKYATNIKFSYDCDVARYFESRGGIQPAAFNALPEVLSQSFHPRTPGFGAEKRMLQQSLQKNRPAED